MLKYVLFFLVVFLLNGIGKAQNLPLVVEAESAQLGSDFEIVEEGDITFVRPKTDKLSGDFPGDETKIITFFIPFIDIDTYEVYAKIRVGSENYNDDSFFLSPNFGETAPDNAAAWYIVNGLVPVGFSDSTDIVTGEGSVGIETWKWINISKFYLAENPITYAVTSTDQPMTFRIGARENGLDIDKIAFAKADLTYTVHNLERIETNTVIVPIDETPGEMIDNAYPDNNTTQIPEEAFQKVKTYINPILPGDHPDLTLFKDGDDFYSCGSCFHFTPYLPILHSTDLVHWEEICRVVPSTWSGVASDTPSGGMWGGAITYFYGSYWIYFSNSAGGGQYFCKADNPAGPWSTPVKVKTTGTTGGIGYDNSVFVDDDGKPYMMIKPGQVVNRIQEIGSDGHLMGNALILDWVNADKKYSWAEGPVMCKHGGWYYYFIAGNVYGGQYVLRSKELTADPDSWEDMGNFFANVTDAAATFRSPNHISQPFQLEDGTWWTISHSYESVGSNDWNGEGRQGLLNQVIWDANGKPTGIAPSSAPQLAPNLPKSGIPWLLPNSDYFENETIALSWHFLNRSAASKYSLTKKPGWLTLSPGSGKCHILHKEARHFYSLVTKLDLDATKNGEEAGIYLTNGNESLTSEIYSAYNDGKVLGFRFNGATTEIVNTVGNELWLKLERNEHLLSAFYSTNGIVWTQIGKAVSSVSLDKGQADYNSWVGTSNGLYAKKAECNFDLYVYKDGFSALPIIAYNNYYGLSTKGSGANKAMTNSSEKGGWAMLGGVDLGQDDRVPVKVEVEAASTLGGQLEIWIDDLENEGTKIASIDITSTGSTSTWQKFNAQVSDLSGQHDIYLRWSGSVNAFLVKNLQFIADDSFYTGLDKNLQLRNWNSYPNPFKNSFTLENGSVGQPYMIYTIDGRLVLSGYIETANQELGQSLNSGMYILKHQSLVVKLNKIE
ncbi:MAG: family 43 glycosylhydrolase [Prolixibacteraceae bacterium]